MTPVDMIVWGSIVVVIVAVALTSVTLANRLDRLHRRLLSTRDELDELVAKRAHLAEALSLQIPEPFSSVLHRDALACLDGTNVRLAYDQLDQRRGPNQRTIRDEQAVIARWERESGLTRDLRHLDDPTLAKASSLVLEPLLDTCFRIHVLRTMHNVDVVQVQHLRSTPLVVVFRLYGRAAQPRTIDFDDDVANAAISTVGAARHE